MRRNEEKKNERIAWLTSIGLHAALLLLFLFSVAWRPPNPPLPQVGLEINFGMDDQGTGEVQPEEIVGSEGTQPEEPNQPEPEENEAEAPQPTETKVEEQVVTTEEETPVKVEQKKEEVREPEKPVVKPEPKKEEPIKPKPDAQATYKPTTPKTESENTTTDGKAGTAGSHGDEKNKTGDKGDPEGSLDAKSLYGKPGGGGGGPSLELSGWEWDNTPNPKIPSSESGRIVFQIKVDENGEIIDIKTLERGVSVEAEKACRAEIQRLTFSKTGANVPDISTGRITFVIRSN
jgi:periplasmic protein TonB